MVAKTFKKNIMFLVPTEYVVIIYRKYSFHDRSSTYNQVKKSSTALHCRSMVATQILLAAIVILVAMDTIRALKITFIFFLDLF